jgi:hypothetical protein
MRTAIGHQCHGPHGSDDDSPRDANNTWLWGEHSYQPHAASGAMNAGVSSPPTTSGTAEPSALVTAIGGDAFATGTGTVTSGVVSNTIKDLGNVTIASGFAVFEAAGTSPTHGGASADADTFLAVAGADIVVEFTFDAHLKLGNTVFAVSETRYMAIDIENWTPPNGPLVLDFHSHIGHNQIGGPDANLPGYAAWSGSLATVAAFADAQGANTATATLAHSLAVENQFSLVSGLSIVAA